MAADLDPAAVLLAGMGMVAAPIVMPQVARELFGADPSSTEFRERYAEQLRRIIARLGRGPATGPPHAEPRATEPRATEPRAAEPRAAEPRAGGPQPAFRAAREDSSS